MNDVILNKIQSIQRCLKRAREEHDGAGDTFATDFTRQDAAILNMTRSCEQSIDLANHVIKLKQLGVPGDSGESFDVLAENGVIPAELAASLKKMTGFRNIAIHEYQSINIAIVEAVITDRSEDLIRFTERILPLAEE